MAIARIVQGRGTVVLIAALAAAALLGAKFGKGGKKTHLGVRPSEIVSLESFTLPTDNTPYPLYYDGIGISPFSVPQGYSFVVTDLFIQPNDFTATDDYFVVLNVGPGGSRRFMAETADLKQLHFALAGGLVMPSGHAPTVRNTSASSDYCVIQILGYFVKGEALGEGEAP